MLTITVFHRKVTFFQVFANTQILASDSKETGISASLQALT